MEKETGNDSRVSSWQLEGVPGPEQCIPFFVPSLPMVHRRLLCEEVEISS